MVTLQNPPILAKLYDSLRHENKQIRCPIVEEFIDSPFSGKMIQNGFQKYIFINF